MFYQMTTISLSNKQACDSQLALAQIHHPCGDRYAQDDEGREQAHNAHDSQRILQGQPAFGRSVTEQITCCKLLKLPLLRHASALYRCLLELIQSLAVSRGLTVAGFLPFFSVAVCQNLHPQHH